MARFKDMKLTDKDLFRTVVLLGQKKLPTGWKWEKLGDVCESWH
jgi:hypothetical protein